jgi:hypothetical protein
MTDLEWFAYVIMPLTVVAIAWGGALAMRWLTRPPPPRPGE